MAQLAIKGHATRGREVIELLEMLGGANEKKLMGCCEDKYYWFGTNERMIVTAYPLTNWTVFTLEDFLEKYPYKVGDKVIDKIDGCVGIVDEMIWDGFSVKYDVTFGYGIDYGCYSAQSLQPYKEETMEGKLISKEDISLKIDTSQMEKRKIIFSADAPNETELVLGDNYEIKVKDGKIYVVRKKPKYPSSFDECLKILGYDASHTIPMNHGHNGLLMMKLQKLLIFRDAYWKIAGEQMGLSKPWVNTGKNAYIIGISIYGEVIKDFFEYPLLKYVFSFPTEEMRDAFYENFKELIETCKELL